MLSTVAAFAQPASALVRQAQIRHEPHVSIQQRLLQPRTRFSSGYASGPPSSRRRSVIRRIQPARSAIAEPGSSLDSILARPKRSHPEWAGVPAPPRPIDIALPAFTRGSREKPFDLLIVGCGPAGLAAAEKAAARGLSVGVVDPNPTAAWRNNYGVWVDEFEALGHGDCFTKTWDTARVILDDEQPAGLCLDRAYGQVDRFKLKSKLLRAAAAAGCEFLSAKVSGLRHEEELSVAQVSGGALVHAAAVLDATGHARRLVEFGSDFTPGYQAAYGTLLEVESHNINQDEMLFMDWRDSHLEPLARERNRSLPTFLYVMPFSPTRIFAEETSLVARPGVDFDDIKIRMQQRLAGLGIKVTRVLEEEHCFIPMGGVLPRQPQRTLGIGGTAGMVHPSTGFMLSKTLKSAGILVEALADGLERRRKEREAGRGGMTGGDLSRMVWERIWPEDEKRMRTFMCFGMETLMQLDIGGTRRFFGTFFALPKEMWSGFLSWRVAPVGLLAMGFSLFQGFKPAMRVEFVLSALPFVPSFVREFFPAGNGFVSRPWSGVALPAPRRPETAPPAAFNLAETLKGNTQILPPQPTVAPILASGLDFPSLIGMPRALAGGVDDVDEPVEPTDYAALWGGDLAAPLPASRCRPDREWVAFQQRKQLPDQGRIAAALPPLPPGATVDAAVVGCGPAGLAIAAALAARGLTVGLIGPESNFTNTYGVWTDEFAELGLLHTLSNQYADGMYWLDEASPNEGHSIGRRYGRVDRAKLRTELLSRCAKGGVRYLPALVRAVDHSAEGHSVLSVSAATDAASSGAPGGEAGSGGSALGSVTCGVAVMACGHNRELLRYEAGKPASWQTAYGIELKLPDHPFPMDRAVFMDLRQSDPEVADGDSASGGLRRVPSFLYVLPTDKDTVFLEETCLMSRVQAGNPGIAGPMPFDELKRRLYRRMDRMGLQLAPGAVLEEEASWIPLGGGLPLTPQRSVAFGAAASLVHPGSGFSIYNSIKRADEVAEAIASTLAAGGGPAAASAAAYEVLWSEERRRQMGFLQFGMELVLSLPVAQLRGFFGTFYRLPFFLAHGFLSHRLSSSGLLFFAFSFFVAGTNELRLLLLGHLVTPAGSGGRLAGAYLGGRRDGAEAAAPAPAGAVGERGKSALDVAVQEQQQAEADGVPTGFQGPRWWIVGRGKA